MEAMSKDDIVDAAVKFVETSMKAVQSQYQRQPGPSSKRNLETSIDYHEAMAEMARAELKLHDEVWRYKEEQMAQNIRKATEPVRVCIDCNCLFNSESQNSRIFCDECVARGEIQLQAEEWKP
jgi:hypothetical protein